MRQRTPPVETQRGKVSVLAAIVIVIAVVVGIRTYFVYQAWNEREPQTQLILLNGLSSEYLITPEQVGELPERLGEEFAVTGPGNIVFRMGNDLVEAEPDGNELRVDRLSGEGAAPDSFALDSGTVLTVVDQYFGQLEDGVPTRALPLPFKGMKVASSRLQGVVYLFSGNNATNHRAYVLQDTGTFVNLAELPGPIIAVSDSPGSVYLATSREIFRLRKGKIDLVIRRPDDELPLTSIAVSDDDETVFYATSAEVYALHGVAALAIVKNAGGRLLWRDGELFLWDRQRSLMVKLRGLSSALYPENK